MATTSSVHGKRLFVGVDSTWGCNVNVAYRLEDEEEVTEFIEAMSLILESVYGARIWSWFTDDVNTKLQGYKWST